MILRPPINLTCMCVPLEDSIAFSLRFSGQSFASFDGGNQEPFDHLHRHLGVAVIEESITVLPRIHYVKGFL